LEQDLYYQLKEDLEVLKDWGHNSILSKFTKQNDAGVLLVAL